MRINNNKSKQEAMVICSNNIFSEFLKKMNSILSLNDINKNIKKKKYNFFITLIQKGSK